MKNLLKLTKDKTSLFKLDLKMKLSALLLLTSIFALQANDSYSQKTKVSVDLEKATVEELIDLIEKKTEYRFLYIVNDIDLNRIISIKAKRQKVNYILDRIFQGTNTGYKIDNRQISLLSKDILDNNKQNKVSNETIQSTVIGTVVDETGTPLPGASIVEKGTTNGVTTDFDGNFSITLDRDTATLVISYIGYATKELDLNGESTINVTLTPSASQLDDVVVIGYGALSKKELTTSVSSVTTADIVNQPVASFDQAVAGKIAGVQIVEPSGEPGVGARIRVRGTSSITAGNDPLYVIDGVPMSSDLSSAGGQIRRPNGANGYGVESVNALSSVNVNDIQSVQILKDASAAAIYGSRGSNGVVIITTNKGKSGKAKISYNAYGGIQEASKKLDLLNAYEFAELNRDGHNNTYLDAVPSGNINDSNATRIANGSPSSGLLPDYILPYLEGTPGLVDTDWQDAIFRTAAVQSHNLSISGGDENTTYYGSLNYVNQEGVVLNSDYEQFSIRLNIDSRISDRIRVGFNLNPSHEIANRINKGPHFTEGILALALAQTPNFPVFNSDGSYNTERNGPAISAVGETRFLNPVALAQEIKNETGHTRFIGNVYGEWDVIKNLTYRLSGGFDLNSFIRDYYRPSTIEDRNLNGPSVPDAYARDDQFQNWIIEHTLNYAKKFGDHNLDILAGFSSQKEKQRTNETYATNFPNDLATTTNAGQIIDAGSTIQEWSLLSYLGRLQYNFKGKYLLSAAVRADGSSRFGENNRWGYFPSVSGGWRVSKEDFFKSEIISDLKLRASLGVTGNFQIPNYGTFGLVSNNNYIDASGNEISGLALSTASNPNLKWEKTQTFDFGLDFGLFDDKLYFELDYYNSKTSDLLLNVPVPALSGFSSTLVNIGEVQNIGFEATVSNNFEIGELGIDTSLNFSTNQNEVLALGPDNADIISTVASGGGFPFITRVGEEISSYYALKTDGVLTQADIDNGVPIFNGSRAGDIKNIDVNGDGVITNGGDRTILGSPFPDYTLGFNTTLRYKNLDFGVSIQSVQGFEVNSLISRYNYNLEGNFNNLAVVTDRYRSDSDPGSGVNPRANRQAKGSLGQPSDRWVEDGSFTRIRNLSLGFTLPETVLGTYVEKARFYVSAQNPFTFTDYQYYNPEVSSTPDSSLTGGQDYGNYPLARTFILGVNLTFK